ncbi:MAG: phosphoribosylglycinamide formyltransferase 1 [Alphaproteobacteria bacterium]|jgi:phosphoribosylglycinamide formyltransferase-1|nr:phosphoribosylglycinamide formyltransferase 1 [Alphaproteobacteria bacterium]
MAEDRIRKRVAVLISGRGSNMAALIEAAKEPDYPAEIALVLSNRADAAGLALAEGARVPTSVLDHRSYGKDRAAFERALQIILDEQRIELICLGGFMRLFTQDFVLRWQERMLNIHPALLPSFRGLDPHGQALQAGVKITGATVHFVTPEMDAGPIILQAAVPVHDDDTAGTLSDRVLDVEHRIYVLALRMVAEDRVRIVDGRCRIDQSQPAGAALINPES